MTDNDVYFEQEDGKIAKVKSKRGNVLLDKVLQMQMFCNDNPFFYDRSKIWWKWNKKTYRYERSDEIDILGLSYEAGDDIITSKERAELMNALKHVGRKNIPDKAKESWVQFHDKIHDIETDEEFDASPRYFITNPIPYWPSDTDSTPNFDRLFSDWVGEENIEELYEILAFAQAPKYFIHRIFCLIGSGANGKSTFLTILRKYLGDENVVSSSLDTLMRNRFEGAKLYKKLVCLMGETNFSTLTQTDYIKGLSGEDKLRIEFKGKDSFDEVNYAKLILATNSLPATADKTEGFYRRWKIMPFPNKFTQERDVLNEIPKSEYHNLARKLLDRLKLLWETRSFTNDGNFEERRKAYEDHSNPLNLFIAENFIRDINSDYPSLDFYEEFGQFLMEKGYRELTNIVMAKQLKLNGFDIKQIKRDGINTRRIIGIKKKVAEVAEVEGNYTLNLRMGNRVKTPATPGTPATQDTKLEDSRWNYE